MLRLLGLQRQERSKTSDDYSTIGNTTNQPGLGLEGWGMCPDSNEISERWEAEEGLEEEGEAEPGG